MSFKKTLLTILIVFATLPILIISFTNYVVSNNSVIQFKQENVKTLTYTNGLALDEFVFNQKHEVNLMSNNSILAEYLMSNKKDSWLENAIDEVLDSWIDEAYYYLNAALIDINGEVVASYRGSYDGVNVKEEQYFSKAITDNYVIISNSDRFSATPDRESIAMSSRVVDRNNNVVGVIVLFVDTNFFDSFIKNLRFESTGMAVLTDANGSVFYYPENEFVDVDLLIGNKQPLSKPSEPGNLDGLIKEFMYTDKGNKTFYVCAYTLKINNWELLIFQSTDEIMSAVDGINYVMVGSLIITFLASIIAAAFISRKITEPIECLQKVFNAAAAKNEYIRCDLNMKNEFGALAGDYNIMIEKLNDHYTHLQDAYKRIEETQKELQKNYNLVAKKETENEKLAYTDLITGLSNKLHFEREFKKILKSGAEGGLIYIDLDDFKNVNEIYGHELGDKFLYEIGKKLSVSKFADIVLAARTSGDEFMIVTKGSKRDTDIYCRQIIEYFEMPVQAMGNFVHTSASIGVTIFPKDATEISTLIKNADIAMFKAKRMGKNTFCYFDDELRRKIHRQNQILEIIRQCIDNKEVFMVYQPEVELKTGKILVFETLMRMKSESIGFLSPAEFIPIAEANGLIIRLGYWALFESCQFIKELIDDGKYDGMLAVNISSAQLMERDFVDKVLQVLDKVGFPPERLQVEITESMLIDNLKKSTHKLSELRKAGVTIALDDFGTSYSSLNYLANLPLDVIKIDKSFIDEVCGNYKKQIILKTIIDMSHNLNLTVVAEGVESFEQQVFLEEQKCDILQGYLYSAPVGTDLVMDLVCKIGNEG